MSHICYIRSKFGLALRVAACILLAACVAFSFAGCRDSDALKEIIYDQTSDSIDKDNPDKIYINDSSSDETTDKLPALENDENAPVTDERQSLVVYGSSPNTKNIETKQSLYDATPEFSGIEASGTVAFYYAEDENASDHEVAHETEYSQDDEELEYFNTSNTEIDSQAPMTGSEGSDDSSSEEGGDSGHDNLTSEESDDGGSDDGDYTIIYNTADPNQKPPKISKIAASGAYATIVAMIGGKGALAATDYTTLHSKFSDVFDCSGVKTGWKSDGEMDVDAIIESGAGAVLLKAKPSNSIQKKLKKANVNITLIGDLYTSQEIKDTVKTVGEMLSDSTSIQYKGKTQDRASDYIEFHDRVVKASCDANGGLAQAGNCGQLQKSSAKDKANNSFSSDSATYTALVVEYDSSAKYVGESKAGWKITQPGLAFGNAGYSSSPVAYYIQAGGLIDNSSYELRRETGGGLAPLWQFWSFKFKKSEWSGSSINKVSSSVEDALKKENKLLLATQENSLEALNLGDSFGTDTFPKLIAKSARIKQGIISNSKELKSTLHPFGFVSSDVISHLGPTIDIYTCIGFSKDLTGSNPLGSSIPEESIEIQPTGLFCDWTTGTVESFLESAWVNDVVKGNSEKVSWENEVQEFYSAFYGYDLTSSDWNYIKAGAE